MQDINQVASVYLQMTKYNGRKNDLQFETKPCMLHEPNFQPNWQPLSVLHYVCGSRLIPWHNPTIAFVFFRIKAANNNLSCPTYERIILKNL